MPASSLHFSVLFFPLAFNLLMMKEVISHSGSGLNTTTISHENMTKKHHLLSLLPSFTKKKDDGNNVSVSSSSTTITSISSSSTIYNKSTCNNISVLQKPIIRAKHPITIPDYSNLRKLFLK